MPLIGWATTSCMRTTQRTSGPTRSQQSPKRRNGICNIRDNPRSDDASRLTLLSVPHHQPLRCSAAIPKTTTSAVDSCRPHRHMVFRVEQNRLLFRAGDERHDCPRGGIPPPPAKSGGKKKRGIYYSHFRPPPDRLFLSFHT